MHAALLLSPFFLRLLRRRRPPVPSYDAVQRRVDELRVYVGEAGELALVDVGDDQLVGRGQHGLRAGEELVEVFRPFAALKDTVRKTGRFHDRFFFFSPKITATFLTFGHFLGRELNGVGDKRIRMTSPVCPLLLQ